jgi:hypothetical protein
MSLVRIGYLAPEASAELLSHCTRRGAPVT